MMIQLLHYLQDPKLWDYGIFLIVGNAGLYFGLGGFWELITQTTGLIALLITTHEPPSTLQLKGLGGFWELWRRYGGDHW